MYDLDAPKMLERLVNISNTILLASNPCIEVWFLLHFKNQTSNIDSKECIRQIDNRCKGYQKGTIAEKLFEKLNETEDKAISRAKSLLDFDNPSSTVYLLIEKLIEFKK